jgi:gliding motility-associated-like protein
MTKFSTLKSAITLFFSLYTSLVLAHGSVITPFNASGGPVINQITGKSMLKAPHKKSRIFSDPVAPVAPTITGFSPSSGPVGTSVTISGTNFNAAKASNIVFFGATRATVTEATESSLTVTVPVGATFQPLSVLNGSTQLTGYSAMPFIITFNPNNSTITNANFFSQQDLHPASSSTAQFMTTGDLDGDGKADVVSVNSDPVTNTVSIFRNISNSSTITAASFADKIELPIDGAPGGMAISDLDGDGKPELVVLDVSGKVSIFRNTSSSGVISFAPKVDLNILNGVSVTVGDLDNDGKPDVVVSDRKDGTVFVFRNTSTSGNISFVNAIAAATFTTGGPENVAIGDLDGDGKADMTVANKVSGLVSIFPNISTIGNIIFGTAIVLTPGTKPVKAALGDFNVDGKPDLAVANSTSSTVSVFQNTSSPGTISFAAKVDLPADTKVTSVAITDLDGDGKVDIVSVAVNGGGTVSVFRNTYTSGTISGSSFAAKSLLIGLLQDVTIGDLDGDGRPDLAGTNLQIVSVFRYNPFTTKVSASFSGKTLAGIDSAISADPVPSATDYRFRVTQGVNVQTIDVQTNSFRLTQLASYAYSASYSIDVQVQAGGSWSNYGPVSVVTTPGPLTQISESFSGKTLANTDSVITADPVPSATGYRFRVTKGAAVQTLDAQTNSFKLNQLPNYAYNTMYSMDVAVKTGATVNAFGAAVLVTTPAVPVTQVAASYCGAVLTDLDGAVRADGLPLATAYRFRVKLGNSPAQIIEEAGAQTLLYKTTFYAYNTTYTVDVSANVNGTWTDYGAACNVTTLAAPVTQVSLINCGKLLTTNDAQISIDHVPTATAYRLRITTNNQTDSLDEPTNFARLGAMPSYEFNTTYSVQVSAFVNGVWTPYGAACNVTTPVLVPQISTEMCGTVLTTIDGDIHQDLIPATSFRFKVTDGVNTTTLQSQVGSVRLSNLPFYAYNTTYTVQVAVQRNDVWTAFGPACNVTTMAVPVTQLYSNTCGTVLNTAGDIHADEVPTATAYRFRVREGNNEQILNSPTAAAKLTNLPVYGFNTTYTIDVSANVAGTWIPYGATCGVTTPAPLTNANLSALTLSAGSLNPVFDSQTLAYTASVANATTSLTLGPTVSDATATVKVNTTLVNSGSASGNISLAVGANPITTVVTAQDGTTTKSYTVTVTRDKTAQVITFSTLPAKTYGNLDFNPGATSDNTGMPVTYTSMNTAVAIIVGGQIHIVGAGTSIITASQVGDVTHYAATDMQQTLTVNRRAITITADSQSKNYGDADPVFTYQVITGILVDTDAFIGTLTRDAGEDVNTYAITEGTLTLGGNYALTYVPDNLSIGTRAVTVTADAQSKTYGDADPTTFTYAITAGSLARIDAFIGTLTRDAGEDVNTYGITKGTLTLGSNYALTYVPAHLTVGTRSVSVTADAKSKTYGDADPALTYAITSGTLAGSDAFTGSLARNLGENFNTYIITQGTLALTGNYTLTYVPANLTISTRAVTVTADAKSKSYGTADPELTYTITAGSLARIDAFIGTLTRDAGEDVNTYGITKGTLTLGSNYALTYVPAHLTVGTRSVSVTADAKSKTYGDADPALTYAITSGTLAGSDAFTGSLARNLGENFNTYIITQGTLTLTGNYTLTYVPANLTISTRAVTVTADAKSKSYGTADPELTYTITAGTLAGSDVFTGVLVRDAGESTNTYTIKQGTLALNSNYVLIYNGTNLTITKKILTITADNQSKVYGSANLALTFTYSGFVNGDNESGLTTPPSLSTTATAGSGVNTYPITVSGAVIPGYSIEYVPGTLTITPAELTVKADNKSRDYSVDNPKLTIAYSGFVNGDDATQLARQAIATTTATTTTMPGNYPITASGAASPDYSFNYVNGVLTIIPLTGTNVSDLTISSGTLSPAFATGTHSYKTSVANTVEYIRFTPTFDPTATTRIDGSLVANGSSSARIPLNTGDNIITVIVTAQDGLAKTIYTVTIYRGAPSATITASNILTPNGDGKNDTWVIQDIQLYPNNSVTIFDRAGRPVYSKRGYNNDWGGTLRGELMTEGTYYYTIDLGLGLPKFNGFITLLKSK